MGIDKNSYANNDQIYITHADLDWHVDFSRKIISGSVVLTAKAESDNVSQLVVDAKDLNIRSIQDVATEVPLEHSLGEYHKAFGSPLTIRLASPVNTGAFVKVKIEYETTDKCTAVQWLEPSQTAGKVHPYLFTQCQAIHCRTLVPIQDSPAHKITYTATVRVNAPLIALMSALSTGQTEVSSGLNQFTFDQQVPIPSYLLALAIGDLQSRDIGPRTRVWSEASMVDAGAFEFADTEKFLVAGEELLNAYCWGRYDILLLPPSFPYGGMENPCLTFVTPTLLAGDKSLANVVAHEIAHSWMGNLITNRTWEHFWMNEGFTVFVERKIIQRLHGKPMQHLHATIGWKDLKHSVDDFGCDCQFTCLHPNLDGVDPDDAFSSVPYEKGFNLLFFLENLVGGEQVFEPFLKHYVNTFQYKTVIFEDFQQLFYDYFNGKVDASILNSIDWETWLHGKGMPSVEPKFDKTLLDAADSLAEKWLSGQVSGSSADIQGWDSAQLVMFFEHLLQENEKRPFSIEQLNAMNDAYHFFDTRNSEVRFRWLTLCIVNGHPDALQPAAAFLVEQGRMKFVRPLYRTLFKSQIGRELAVSTFKQHRNFYHSIASKMIAKDLEIDS